MELFQVDDVGLLFVSPEIVDWRHIAERNVRLVIDLDACRLLQSRRPGSLYNTTYADYLCSLPCHPHSEN